MTTRLYRFELDHFGRPHCERHEDEFNFFKFGRVYPKWAGNHRWDEIRSKEDAPYSYSPFLVAGRTEPYKGEDIETYYDDRMHSWYGDKWTAALKKVLGDKSYHAAGLGQLSAAIGEVFEDKVECLQILEGCNVGNGFPYRIFVIKRLDYVHVWPKGITKVSREKRPRFSRQRGRTWDKVDLILPNGKKIDCHYDTTWGTHFYFQYGRDWRKGRIDAWDRAASGEIFAPDLSKPPNQ